jgi:hypothetical protein
MNKRTQEGKEQPYIPNIAKIVAFENGAMTDKEMAEFFQQLIDSGVVWKLQGTYGRMAEHLIAQGICKKKL